MAHITTPKLHSLFARAKEQEGRYEEAAAAYERAKDTDNVVRVLLTLLDAPQKAFALVRSGSEA
jgi:WD repeat-containing protein 19